MPPKINEIGNKYFRLTVLEEAGKNSNGKICWLCECSCENHTRKIVSGVDLRCGRVKSCGCLNKEAAKIVGKSNVGSVSQYRIDETGNLYGRIKVLRFSKTINGRAFWECQCSCNPQKTFEVMGKYLRSGEVKSCGCLKSYGEELISKILEENNIFFEREKTFDDCINPKTGRKLRFDFFVNGAYIIEFDGEQHYNKKNGFYSEEGIVRDRIKDEWALKNKIPLIRIKYNEISNLTIDDLVLIKGGKDE
jgi:hypothetical protein